MASPTLLIESRELPGTTWGAAETDWGYQWVAAAMARGVICMVIQLMGIVKWRDNEMKGRNEYCHWQENADVVKRAALEKHKQA